MNYSSCKTKLLLLLVSVPLESGSGKGQIQRPRWVGREQCRQVLRIEFGPVRRVADIFVMHWQLDFVTGFDNTKHVFLEHIASHGLRFIFSYFPAIGGQAA